MGDRPSLRLVEEAAAPSADASRSEGAELVLQLGTLAELRARCGSVGTVTVGLTADELDAVALDELLNRGFFDVLHASEWQPARLERTLLRGAAFGRTTAPSPAAQGAQDGFLETIVDAAPIGIAYWDKDLRYQRVNAALAAINGLPVEAHYGRTLSQLLPGIPEQASLAIEHVLRTGEALSQEVTGRTPAQPEVERSWRVNYYPVRAAGGVDGVAAICEETTERKHADKERERFIAVLGHDLRNPLSAVLMSTQVLRSRVGERERVVVDRIKRSALRMQRMIRDLLDFARIRQGGGIPLRPTPGDLVELVRDVVLELKQAHPDAQVELDGPAALPGTWDLERLTQMTSNLVGNAIMHGTPGQPVEVVLAETTAEQVRLEVRNAGQPPNPDRLEQLFAPFRAGSGEGNRDSLGLGLFIARALAEAHGGRVNLRVADGATTASVTLPRHLAPRH